jgi:hypothetical protein
MEPIQGNRSFLRSGPTRNFWAERRLELRNDASPFQLAQGFEGRRSSIMKRFIIALTALVALTGTASAVEFGVGPGGVYVGPDRYNHRYYRDYGDDYGGGCRVVITHHTNRYGEDVTVRRRVCD